jgi:hypothetical protein
MVSPEFHISSAKIFLVFAEIHCGLKKLLYPPLGILTLNYIRKFSKKIPNYFRSIVELRNLCAHGSVLFDHKLLHYKR